MHLLLRLLVFLLITAVAATARADGERRSARFLPAIEALTLVITEMAARPDVPGISLGVAFENRLVWTQGFGFADIENQVPMSPRSRLRVGSIANVMTAAALARLHEKGAIDLDANVSSLVPVWPKKAWPISLRQLAGHQAGVRHYKDGEFFLNRRYASVTEGLEIFKDDPLLFEPGSAISYSSYGWNLISAAIETAADRDFLQFMRSEVFLPLTLEDTVADRKGARIANRAALYALDELGRLVAAPEVDNSYNWAGGGFLSSAGDLASFALAHARPGYLKAETLDLLFTRQTLADGTVTRFGIGWMVGFDYFLENIAERLAPNAQKVGRKIMASYPGAVMHSGSSVGGQTMLILSRRHRLAVAVVINSSDGRGLPLLIALQTLHAFIRNARAIP